MTAGTTMIVVVVAVDEKISWYTEMLVTTVSFNQLRHFSLPQRSALRYNNKVIHNEDACSNQDKITTYCNGVSSSNYSNTYIASTNSLPIPVKCTKISPPGWHIAVKYPQAGRV